MTLTKQDHLVFNKLSNLVGSKVVEIGVEEDGYAFITFDNIGKTGRVTLFFDQDMEGNGPGWPRGIEAL